MGTLSGCGKSSDSGSGLVGGVGGGSGTYGTASLGQCGSGPYSFSDPSCLTDFTTACIRAGGLIDGSRSQTCMFTVADTVTNQTGLLNPFDANAPFAGRGILVRSGDQITFYGSGTWGTTNANFESEKILGIFTVYWGTWSTPTCNKVNINGVSDGKVGYNDGLAAGLIGSVSGTSEVFFVGGTSLNNYLVRNSGVLHFGMNAPSELSGLCGGYTGTLKVTVR